MLANRHEPNVLTIFAEVFIKTTHLILMLEEARSKVLEHSGQAVVLGSYTG